MSTESMSCGKVIVDALARSGVNEVFGVPGESFLGILDALYEGPMRFVSTRHESGAAFMASGYSKISGQLGVCFGTRAVGTCNMAIGIHEARQDSRPLIAIAGQVQSGFKGREAFQEVDLVAAMAPLCKWAVEITDANRAPEIMARAIHIARSGRPGPVLLAVPQEVSRQPSSGGAIETPSVHAPDPHPAAINRMIEALRGARAPLIFAGGGASVAPDGFDCLVQLAEATEIPVITNWRHHDGFPNDHRLFLGCAGLGASSAVWQRLEAADAVVVLGNRMQENATSGYRLPSLEARLFHVDLDPTVMVNHRVPEMAIQADATRTARALLAAWPTPDPTLADRRTRNDLDRRQFEAATAIPPALGTSGRVDYPHVIGTLRKTLPADGILATDGGNFYGWISRYFRFVHPRTYVGPASGAMGYGLPGAIGAKLARPDRDVVSVSGDGGFLMTMQELETAVRYEVPVTAIVLDNARHGTIRMHQEREYPARVVGTDLTTPNLAEVARAFGAKGWRVESNDEFEPALMEAIRSEGPRLIHVLMDPDQLSIEGRLEI